MERFGRWMIVVSVVTVMSGALAFAAGVKAKKPSAKTTTQNPKPITQPSKAPSNRPRPTLALQVSHSGAITCVSFSPDGRTLATASSDRTVRLWDGTNFELKATLQGHTELVGAMAFSPAGKLIATGSVDGTARIWDARSGQMRNVLKNDNFGSYCLAFSPNGKLLATAGDRLIKIWDVDSAQLRTTCDGHTQDVRAIAFSPDAKTLVSGSAGTLYEFSPLARHAFRGEMILWDAQVGQLQEVMERDVAINSLVFSANGKMLAAGGGRGWIQDSSDGVRRIPHVEGIVALYHRESGSRRIELKGHTGIVRSVSFTPDGSTVASGSVDTTTRVWDTATGDLRFTLRGHSQPVAVVTCSPDGRLVATGSAIPQVNFGEEGVPFIVESVQATAAPR